MRIGYFGGSFDPPHNGHLAIARAAATAFSLDRVLFAPTGNQPLKPLGLSASYFDRLAMVTLLCTGDATLEASALELPHDDKTPNYTVDTLRHLRFTQPSTSIFVLTGVDAFLGVQRWLFPKILFTLADWIVISRPGFSLDEVGDQLKTLALTPEQLARVHLLPGLADPTSATHIRHLLQTGGDVSKLLPPAVVEYIRSHRLYQTG